VLPWFWPWILIAEHLLLLGLLGSILADISLTGFRKIPFTCSYLPGKSKAHIAFWFGIIPLVVVIDSAVRLEWSVMTNRLGYWVMVATIGIVALAARRITNASANLDGPDVQFEESPSDQLVGLSLNA
jgi:hypothetical protein